MQSFDYISPSPIVSKTNAAHFMPLVTPPLKQEFDDKVEYAPLSTSEKPLSFRRFDWEDDDQEENPPNYEVKRPGRKGTKWGLRNLSQRVLFHVIRLGSSTYSQVAEQLLIELSSQAKFSSQTRRKPLKQKEPGKTEQNIKRRVYDALNVMTASQTISKEGRKIFSSHKQANQRRLLLEAIDEQRRRLQLKHKHLQETQLDYESISALVSRNRLSPSRQKLCCPAVLLLCEEGGVAVEQGRVEVRGRIKLVLGDVQLMRLCNEKN